MHSFQVFQTLLQCRQRPVNLRKEETDNTSLRFLFRALNGLAPLGLDYSWFIVNHSELEFYSDSVLLVSCKSTYQVGQKRIKDQSLLSSENAEVWVVQGFALSGTEK